MTQLDGRRNGFEPFQSQSESLREADLLNSELQVSHQGAIYRSSPNLENWIETLDLFGEDAFAVRTRLVPIR